MDNAKQNQNRKRDGENQNRKRDGEKRKKAKDTKRKIQSKFELVRKGVFLHEDITFEILSRLPAETILIFKQVCKIWGSVFSSTYFIDKNLRARQLLKLNNDGEEDLSGVEASKENLGLLFSFRFKREPNTQLYYEDYDKILRDENMYSYEKLTMIDIPPTNKPYCRCDPIGSSNGLVCFALTDYYNSPYTLCHIYNPVYILNPLTREYFNLPRLPESYRAMTCGFGFSPISNEYKVVRIYYSQMDSIMGHVQVYTIGSGSGWRTLGGIQFKRPKSGPLLCGIDLDGALHWLDKSKSKILAFNIAEEVFSYIDLPPSPGLSHTADYIDPLHVFYIGVMGRCLCLFHEMRFTFLNIWSLENRTKNEPGNWKMKVSIKYEGLQNIPFAATKKDEVLVWQNNTILSRYDSETMKFIQLTKADRGLESFYAIPHVNSLVSIKALGENNCKKRRRFVRKDITEEV